LLIPAFHLEGISSGNRAFGGSLVKVQPESKIVPEKKIESNTEVIT
jgi:hypothetical protein